MIHALRPVSSMGVQPNHRVSIKPTQVHKPNEVPFGLATVSFGHKLDAMSPMTPRLRPADNVGTRLDVYA